MVRIYIDESVPMITLFRALASEGLSLSNTTGGDLCIKALRVVGMPTAEANRAEELRLAAIDRDVAAVITEYGDRAVENARNRTGPFRTWVDDIAKGPDAVPTVTLPNKTTTQLQNEAAEQLRQPFKSFHQAQREYEDARRTCGTVVTDGDGAIRETAEVASDPMGDHHGRNL